MKKNIYPVWFQILPMPFPVTLLCSQEWLKGLLVFVQDKDSASNPKDQNTYSHIASLVTAESDCIQFDYILWVGHGGTTELIRTVAQITLPDWKCKKCLNT